MKKKILLINTLLLLFLLNTYAQHDPFQLAIGVHHADSILTVHDTLDHSIIIIDIRTPGEYAGGFIEGAINHNYYGAGFDDTLAGLDKNKEYLIYCASGGRSAGAFNKMKAHNFDMVYNMLGGVSAWRAAGYPLVTGGTGIDELIIAKTEIKIYPNPVTSDSKFILLDQSGQKVDVNILNIQGQIIEQFVLQPGDEYKLQSDKLMYGLYFYQVYLDGGIIQSGKFIKTR